MTKNKHPHRFFSRSLFVLGRASLRSTTDWLLPKLQGPDYWVHNKVLTKTFFMFKNFFLKNEYICKKDLYFICSTNIFYVKIYFWNEIFRKKKFDYKTFFPYKKILSANNVYFVKNTTIFSKKIVFFNLVLQQMNNHIRRIAKIIQNESFKDNIYSIAISLQ